MSLTKIEVRNLLYEVCDELEKALDKPIPPSLKTLIVGKVLNKQYD